MLAIDNLKQKEFGVMRQVAKKEWIKTSFWMPENNHTIKYGGHVVEEKLKVIQKPS